MSRARKHEVVENPITIALRDLKLSTEEMADMLGISKVHVSRMSKQKELSLQIVRGVELIVENELQKREIEALKKEIEVLRSLVKS